MIDENRTIISLGTEFLSLDLLSLRAGYLLPLFTQSLNHSITIFTGFGAGIGLNIFGLKTDYSFIPFGILGDTHRLSISMKF